MHTTRNYQRNYVMARIMRDGVMHQQNFSLKEFGSWPKAEAAAQQWISELKATLPEAQPNAVDRMSSRNSSGIVGVRLAKNVRRMKNRKRHTYWSWKAKWPECPLSGGIAWAINDQRSDEDAFLLAALSRKHKSVDREYLEKQLLKLYGSDEHYELIEAKLESPGIRKPIRKKAVSTSRIY